MQQYQMDHVGFWIIFSLCRKHWSIQLCVILVVNLVKIDNGVSFRKVSQTWWICTFWVVLDEKFTFSVVQMSSPQPSVSERSSPDCKSLNQPKMWKVKWGHSLQTTYINIWILKLKQPQIGKYYKTVYCIQYTYRYEPSEMDWMQGWAGMTFGHLGTGTGMAQPIPKLWEREREWKIVFPTFGNGNGNENSIPNFWERERE